MTEAARKRRTPTTPRPVTATYLRNAAMHYIAGRAASVAMVRQTLERRAKRRLMVRSLESETRDLIEAAIAGLVKLKLIDDVTFAETRARGLARKGLSASRIRQGLQQKGIDAATIQATPSAEVDELAQARRFVERKRLGTLRRGGATPETRNKDLRALARAGFSFAIAAKALAETDDN